MPALFIILLIYAYVAFSLQTIANKTNSAEDSWFAWVPVLNIFLMTKIAGKPGWYLILCFVPFVNVVIGVILWMAIAEACGKPNWLGILLLVPIANFILPGYLAFSK